MPSLYSLFYFSPKKIVQISPGAPVVAVVVPKKENSLSIPDLKKEMVEICRENRVKNI
jgi:hypothetical protein